MTNTLTEQWREGTLERGYYYYKTKVGAEVIGYQCFGLKFPYDYNHNTIDSIKEVLGPVPDYMDCKGLIYDSINLADARKRIDELVSKTELLEKRLADADKTLRFYDNKDFHYEVDGVVMGAEPAHKYFVKWNVLAREKGVKHE